MREINRHYTMKGLVFHVEEFRFFFFLESIGKSVKSLFFSCCATRHVGSQFPNQGSNPCSEAQGSPERLIKLKFNMVKFMFSLC